MLQAPPAVEGRRNTFRITSPGNLAHQAEEQAQAVGGRRNTFRITSPGNPVHQAEGQAQAEATGRRGRRSTFSIDPSIDAQVKLPTLNLEKIEETQKGVRSTKSAREARSTIVQKENTGGSSTARSALQEEAEKPSEESRANTQRDSRRKESSASLQSALYTRRVGSALKHVAAELTQAVSAYQAEKGLLSSPAESWARFVHAMDNDKNGRMSFDELVEAVRLHLRANISRYQLLVLWRRLDEDGSGEVTTDEFTKFMYRIDLSDWPDASDEEIAGIVRRIQVAAKWLEADHKWHNLFSQGDVKTSGHVTFDDLKRSIRSGWGGVRLTPQEMKDEELAMLWKACDSQGKMRLPLPEFIAFMRRAQMSGATREKAKVEAAPVSSASSIRTLNAAEVPQVAEEEEEEFDVPGWLMQLRCSEEATPEELQEATAQLSSLLGKWLQQRGFCSNPAWVASPTAWHQLFTAMDFQGHGRISFLDFQACARDVLRAGKQLLERGLHVIWTAVDMDVSGVCSHLEFAPTLYRLQLATWPRLDDAAIRRVVDVLDAAVHKLHGASAPLYKVLLAAISMDEDDFPRLMFSQFAEAVRKYLAGLSLGPSELSDDELRGIWRSMDEDLDGFVYFNELTLFMRQHGKAQEAQRQADARKQRELAASKQAPERNEEELLATKRALDAAMMHYLRKRGVRCRLADGWDRLFEEADERLTGRPCLDKFWQAIKQRLPKGPSGETMQESPADLTASTSTLRSVDSLARSGFTFQDVQALWQAVDTAGCGRLAAKDWLQATYHMELKTWPEPVESEVLQTVNAIKTSVDKTQYADKWYQVFRMIDADSTGKIDWNEFQSMVRRPAPCLGISSKSISPDQLKMLWKALDTQRAGLVKMGDFMVFMKRQSEALKVKPPEFDRAAEIAKGREVIAQALASYTADTIRLALEGLRQITSVESTGNVTEWDWHYLVRAELQIAEEDVSDDAIHGVWVGLDRSTLGELEASKLLERLSMQSARLGASGSCGSLTDLLQPMHMSNNPLANTSGSLASSEQWEKAAAELPAKKAQKAALAAMRGAGGADVIREAVEGEAEIKRIPDASLVTGGGWPVDQSDPAIRMVAERLSEALLTHYQQRGIHCSVAAAWSRFFHEMDTRGLGHISFAEFDQAVSTHLRRARVLRYELHMLFRRIDDNDSGAASQDEVVQLFYRYEMDMWPQGTPEDIVRVVRIVHNAVVKWHDQNANWFRVFKYLDTQGVGAITYDDLKKFIRGHYPGLHIDKSELPNDDILRLWKAMDSKMRMRVQKTDFMAFMRRHLSVKVDDSSKPEKKAEADKAIRDEIAHAPNLSRDSVRAIAMKLAGLLQTWLKSRIKTFPSVYTPSVWNQLFEVVDLDGSGRLTYVEYEDAVMNVMRGHGQVTAPELKALWRSVAGESTKGMTRSEVTQSRFASELYKLQLEGLPRLSDKDCVRLVKIMNAAAHKWHHASGNWFKIMKQFDEDGNGDIEFEEFIGVVRKSFPGLAIGTDVISEFELRGMWRALDSSMTGAISRTEFMVWMRHYGKDILHVRQFGNNQRKRTQMKEDGLPPRRTPQELCTIKHNLEVAVMSYMNKKGYRCPVQEGWQKVWNDADDDRSGRLSLFEFKSFLQQNMLSKHDIESHFDSQGHNEGDEEHPEELDADREQNSGELVVKGVMHEDLRAVWAIADADNSGEVTGAEWSIALYQMETSTWPSSKDINVAKVVQAINTAANKYYQAENNWFKVFNLVDPSGIGRLDFEGFQHLIRQPLPSLGISTTDISEQELRGLWMGLDARRQGVITIQEFMVFMRRHQRQKVSEKGLKSERKKEVHKEVTAAQELLGHALAKYSVEHLMAAYESWGMPWTGAVSEWEWQMIVRKLLSYDQAKIDDSALHSIWVSMDREMHGYLDANDLLYQVRTGKRRNQQEEAPLEDEPEYVVLPWEADASAPMTSTARYTLKHMHQEMTYWRNASWTSHLRPGGKTRGLRLPKVATKR
eukprot:TRINITY_DN2712_c0_g1_i3.p1 TRINITY_DN2712_c0_g1~~TRINITY_DN2712_c0_g1_i3.p1  ORF type:complete len:1988 (-),score=454.39 TRINITY_DN2712_c0_g1_i3:74-6037(-)